MGLDIINRDDLIFMMSLGQYFKADTLSNFLYIPVTKAIEGFDWKYDG